MDVEKTIEFILNQQAQLHLEQQKQAESHTKLQNLVHNLVGVVSEIATNQRKTEKRIDALDERLSSLAAKVETTTENLNALIKVVDDLIRRNNGGRHIN